MSVSIIEALCNAEANIDNARRSPACASMFLTLAKEQLHNAVELLDKGYGLDDEVEPLLEQYGDVESVPEAIRKQKGGGNG